MKDIKERKNIKIKKGISDFYIKKYGKLIENYSMIYNKQVDDYNKEREEQLKNMYNNIMNIYNKDKLIVHNDTMSIIDTTYMNGFKDKVYYINNPNQSKRAYSGRRR